MSAKVFTVLAAKAAKPKRNAAGALVRAEYPDRGCTGLYLVVQPSGLKSWALRYRFDGAPRKLALGSFADHEVPGGDALTVAGARKAAAEARHKVEQGMDPAAQKRQAKASAARLAVLRTADSVEALAEQFLSLYAKPRTRPRTHQQTEDVLRRLVLPAWRGHTVHEVRRRGVIALVEDIAAEHGPHMADKARAVLGKFFAWLVARDVIAASPCLGIERLGRNVPRERVLDDPEVAALWRACCEEGVYGAFAKTLLLTGARRGEVAGMRWSEINQAERVWTLPPQRVKNGRTFTVPLSSQTFNIVVSTPRFAGCDFVFTAEGRRPVGGFTHVKRKLDRRAKIAKGWRLHDLRRTCASGMQRLGVPVEVIEACLNHRSGTFRGIVGVYQRHDYLDERRTALQRWADQVEQLVTGEPAAVVPLHGRRR